VCNAGASNAGRSICVQISGNGATPWQYIDTTRKAIDCATILPLRDFGRPFVKRFALCYRSVVCVYVCPVCNVRALWPNGWTDQDEIRMRVGLGPGHIVLDGDPAPAPQRGTASPQFSAHICYGQMASWFKMSLGMELGFGQGDFVLNGDPLPLPKKGVGAEPPNFRPMFIATKRLDE